MKSKIAFLFMSTLLVCVSDASTIIRIKSGTIGGTTLQNQNGTPLTAGTASSGNGALLEFGYYSVATNADPFSGTWNALTGPNSVSMISTTIGDDSSFGNGTFGLAFELSSTLVGLPVDGTPLAIRFYNSTTRANSTAFNAVAVTDGDWNWSLSASFEQIEMVIDPALPLVWQGGPSSAQRTTVPIPEPSISLLLLGSAVLCGFRRRKS